MKTESMTTPTLAPPPVLFWFRWYAGLMAAMYGLCVLAGPVLLVLAARTQGRQHDELLIQAVVMMIIGLPLTIACLVPFFLPRKPGAWVYDLVVICIGLTSCCCMPVTIPLLIYWIKPETKAWFNQA
jgi:MFS family permease